mmetsp:Transcript_15878/g.20608  ORF Transcript_15878/g.20608 Transcript_15878/m.20608 type:complete len:175 (+) Transcript_15878:51-575(+)
MQKRKVTIEDFEQPSKQQCISDSQQQRNLARAKIIEERKERNRLSAAASRKRKDEEINTLREQVQKLTKDNEYLMKTLKFFQQQIQMTNSLNMPIKNHNNNNTSLINQNLKQQPSCIVNSDVNSDDENSFISDQFHNIGTTSKHNQVDSMTTMITSSQYQFFPNSCEPAVFKNQ